MLKPASQTDSNMYLDDNLGFHSFIAFLKKQYLYNKNIPHAISLSEFGENTSFMAKGINKSLKVCLPTNHYELVENFKYYQTSGFRPFRYYL